MTSPATGDQPAFVDADEGLQQAVAADSADTVSSAEREPAEEGPRRTLLVVLAAVAGAVLLWLLFRSVPEAGRPAGDGRAPAGTGPSVEQMANEADPSWMQAPDTARGVPAAPGSIVPPVYGPAGSGVGDGARPADQPGAGDAGDAADSAAAGPAAAGAEAQPENPRRQAFLAALRSKPLQGGASFAPERSADQAAAGGAEGELPEPPSQAQMDSAAQAEAERRSVPPGDGGFPVSGIAPGSRASSQLVPVTPSRGRSSSSSYVTGGSSAGQQAAAPQQLVPRRSSTGSVVVPVGTVIEGQLHTRINSDLPGSVVGMVTRDVFDTSQRIVVIPRYSWLFGTYESDVATGQARLVVQWTAIRFPGGETYELPALRAAERTGASGLPGQVNNHYGRIFGQAVLSSIVTTGFDPGRSERAEGERRTARDVLADATAQQLGQTAAEVTRRNLDIKPTWTSRAQVTPFSIILDRDLVFTQPPAP